MSALPTSDSCACGYARSAAATRSRECASSPASARSVRGRADRAPRRCRPQQIRGAGRPAQPAAFRLPSAEPALNLIANSFITVAHALGTIDGIGFRGVADVAAVHFVPFKTETGLLLAPADAE